MNDSELCKAYFSNHVFLPNHRPLPFVRRDGNDQDPGEYYLFAYLCIRFLFIFIRCKGAGNGKRYQGTNKNVPRSGEQPVKQEIVDEAEKQAEGSVKEKDEEYPQRTAEGIMVHLLEMEDHQGAQRTGGSAIEHSEEMGNMSQRTGSSRETKKQLSRQ